jgi:hypothetical protein
MAGGAETSNIAALPAIALQGQPGRILPLANIIGPCGERTRPQLPDQRERRAARKERARSGHSTAGRMSACLVLLALVLDSVGFPDLSAIEPRTEQ